MNDYLIILKILSEVISGKNLNEVFNKNIIEETINVSKVKDICYGVMRNYFILTSILNNLIKTNPQSEIKTILLIAIYEIQYSQKPDYAVTNDMVDLSFKLTKNIKIKNFVNAVIRNFLRTREIVINNQEYKYNSSAWMINKLKYDYPHDWEDILKYSNLKPKISLRINFKKISLKDYIEYLKKYKINYSLIDDIIILEDTMAVDKIPLFMDGYVSIQDINAQKLKDIIKLNNNQYVLDACCAPGGKTCQILENNNVDLLALDIDKDRLYKLEQNLIRLHLSAKLLCADAAYLNWWDKNLFDVIIADVPCSASGTLKRNPDIKLHRQLSDIKNFVNTQRKIILNLWKVLKNNGYLVYITCSIFKEENQENIKFFQHELKELKVIKELQLLPDQNGDGFYYCLLKKENKDENL